jgi:hypothetical protein
MLLRCTVEMFTSQTVQSYPPPLYVLVYIRTLPVGREGGKGNVMHVHVRVMRLH